MSIPKFLISIIVVMAMCGVAAAQTSTGDGFEPAKKKTVATAVGPALEMASYLGVAASPASAALREQIRLKPGVGLVVEHVDKGSPAEQAGLKQYDVLEKFDDQWMVNSEQLAVLIRLSDPGSEIKLSIIRQGQPQTLSAKLIEKELPPLASVINDPVTSWTLKKQGVSIVDPADPFQPARTGFSFDGSGHMRITSTMGPYVLTLTSDNGRMHLVVADNHDNNLYDGKLDSQQDLKGLSEDLVKRVNQLLTAVKVSLPATTLPSQP